MSYTPTEWESTDVVTATRLNALEQAVGDLNMSYTPNVWQNGDILTADKMNALEQAVASGGGGSSDFTTAQVTIINTLSYETDCPCPVVADANELVPGIPSTIFPYFTLPELTTTTRTVPLYNGLCIVVKDLDLSVVSGDATDDESLVLITGDCVLTTV